MQKFASSSSFMRRPAIVGGAAALLLAPLVAVGPAFAAPAQDAELTTFGPAVEATTLVVPDGVCSVNVSLGGGFGGYNVIGGTVSDQVQYRGSGAVINATLDVQAGDTLELLVGGNGADATTGGLHGGGDSGKATDHPGGGGGGYTSLSFAGDLLLLAGGGGGSGGGHQLGFGGGGDAGFTTSIPVPGGTVYPGAAGDGGFDDNSDTDLDETPRNPLGGGGGGATAGGEGGTNTFSDTDPAGSGFNFDGFAGAQFQGGVGGADHNLDGSGGGGGGYFGGGGGASTQGQGNHTGSGGGGSSFVADAEALSDVSLANNRYPEGHQNEFSAAPAFAGFEWIMCDYTLSIEKSVLGTPVFEDGELVRFISVFEDGAIVRYSVTVTNDGDDIMAIGDTVTLIDDLAVGGTVVSVTGLGDSDPAIGDAISAAGIELFDWVDVSDDPTTPEWVKRGLAVGESVTVEYDVVVTGVEPVTNTVTTTDRNGEHSDEAIIAPAEPSLSLEKSADTKTVTTAGQKVIYSFTVTNTGNIELRDIVIEEGEFSGKGTLDAPVCPTAPVMPGESTTCTAVYTAVKADLTGKPITNTATAGASTPMGNDVVSEAAEAELATQAPLPATGAENGLGWLTLSALLLLGGGAAVLTARTIVSRRQA